MLLRKTTLKSVLLMGALLSIGCSHQSARKEQLQPRAIRSPDQVIEYTPPPPVYSSTPIINKNYFDWPVDEARLTRGFLPYRKRPHLGLDLASRRGTPIYASHDGTIIYVGKAFKGFGKMIMIEGQKGWATLYAHLAKTRVKEGQKVYQGSYIGDMGSTGRSTGVHLHFEIRNRLGPVDPLSYLPKTRMASSVEIEIDRLAILSTQQIENDKIEKNIEVSELNSDTNTENPDQM